MKSRITLIAAGIGCFLLFLIVSVPATLFTSLLPGDDISVSGVTGTIWRGRIERVGVAGLTLRELDWRLAPSALLAGRASLNLNGQLPGGQIAGKLSISLAGTVRIRDAQGRAAAAPLGKALGLPQAAGTIEFDIGRLDIRNGWPRQLVGTASVTRFPLMPDGAAPGSFQVQFDAAEVAPDGSLAGALSDLGGPIEVSGTITLLPPADYELSGMVRARGDAPADLVNGLNLLGPADAEGRRQFSIAGSI